jgi:bacterioferritin (cytochrome b1)|tara:strand:- start:2531 stop:2971 length:441 start_codon:yes stop_codon:yes gene_type:complete
MAKEEITKMLNQALELEHAARIQYLSHAELVEGENAEPIVARLKEIASDEKEHEDKFRNLIGNFLGGVPSMKIVPTKKARTVKEILETNLQDEKNAVEVYSKVLDAINKEKGVLPYEFLTLEHDVRHVIMDEQEHIAELKTLLAIK